MRWPGALIAAATVAFLSATYVAGSVQARDSADLKGPPYETSDSNAYVGSQTCQRCHESAYETWQRNLHLQMTKPVAEARMLGDFGGASLKQYGRAYSMDARAGRYFISVAHNSRPAEKFEVHYTLGARRFQGYLSKLSDGRIYVLPVFWHNETSRWVDWKEITPIPDDKEHDLRQIWNVTCVNCHATNLARNFDPATNTYATTWTEMGIGCEACHGPGARHVEVANEWTKNPATKPAEPDAAQLKIFSVRQATPRQIFDTCAYCHGNKNNLFFGFKPGDRYEDFALPFLISQPIPDNDPQGEFWPDGRPNRFNRPQALTLTGCFQKGEATCTNCHRMHGSSNDHALRVQVEAAGGGLTRQSDALCMQCHGPGAGQAGWTGLAGRGGQPGQLIGDVAAHSHHAPESQGSRCIACHMSDVNWRLITRRRDHTFQPPVPEMTSRFGVPNACTTCHEDKSPEWAAATMDTWYGNGERRAGVMRMSDTMYRAGAGDANVLPDVARLAVTRSHGTLIRASAAEFVGQLIAKSQVGADLRVGPGADTRVRPYDAAIINSLIGAAADPEPTVRVMAIRALSFIKQPRVAAVVAAHLTDQARLVRIGTAEALMALGITQLEGASGAALVRAQDEWAESLRTFNDVAADHTTLGWLEAARGRGEQAAKELRVAITLDPADARPHVHLGILAARDGRYEEALQHFKTAKALAPTYQNLDLLIAESAKRTSKGY